jgi:hypothetical protein
MPIQEKTLPPSFGGKTFGIVAPDFPAPQATAGAARDRRGAVRQFATATP